jgi:large subunit ribosomal protein L25
MKFDVAAVIREQAGKGAARQLRRQGKIPAVLYGQGECLLLTLDPAVVTRIVRGHGGSAALINLNISGPTTKTGRTALLRDFQVDPVTGEILHADLFEVSMTKAIRIKVPVSLVGGTPAGVKEGGVLHHNLRELHVECLPSAIPDSIEVDASGLQINQGLHIRDLAAREGLKFLDESDQMVVSVAAPISEAKLEALLTSGAAVEEGKEPEVIGKGKEEPTEEGVEKAAAAEAKGEKKETKEPKVEKKEAKEEKKK